MIKTCIIFNRYKKFNIDDDWTSTVDYGRFDTEKGKSAADIIDELKRYHRQSSFAFEIDNIVIG